ncbi:hypothetical protein ACROYT_G004578 [Oculina patagonica]
MQPYRNITSNQFFPIYWTDCRQCSCENCICRENTRSSPTPNAEVRRSTSFTIESLLSPKEERKPADVKPSLEGASALNVALVSSATGQFPNDRSPELIHSSAGYLTSFRRQSFGFEQMSLLARGNIQTNGTFLSRGEETDWANEKPKRMRTIFTVEQLERLEREFTRQQYMVGGQRFYLSKELGLTETQVKVWFQNRRIKWRKQLIEQQRSKVRHQKEPSAKAQVENNCS